MEEELDDQPKAEKFYGSFCVDPSNVVSSDFDIETMKAAADHFRERFQARVEQILYTHPDNEVWLMRELQDKIGNGDPLGLAAGIEIVTSPYCDRTTESKSMVQLPDGTKFKDEDFVWRTRFITYGPEDIDYLLYAGKIKRPQERAFFQMPKQTTFADPMIKSMNWSW